MDFSPRLIEDACRTELDADRAVLRSYVHGVTNLLGFAGSIAAAEELLEAFQLYRHFWNPHARLIMLGTEWPQFRENQQVTIVSSVSATELKGYFLLGHVVLLAQPTAGQAGLLAALMAQRLPCIVWGSASFARRWGDSMLAWREAPPAFLAESIHQCVEDPAVGEVLMQQQLECLKRGFDVNWDDEPSIPRLTEIAA